MHAITYSGCKHAMFRPSEYLPATESTGTILLNTAMFSLVHRCWTWIFHSCADCVQSEVHRVVTLLSDHQ